MPREITTADGFKKRTIESMKNLGTYRSEYDQIIDVYAKLLEQYEKLRKNIGLDDLMVRSDATITLEKLRTDIAKYADMLCLSPKSFEKAKIKEKPKKTKLEQALELMSNG